MSRLLVVAAAVVATIAYSVKLYRKQKEKLEHSEMQLEQLREQSNEMIRSVRTAGYNQGVENTVLALSLATTRSAMTAAIAELFAQGPNHSI